MTENKRFENRLNKSNIKFNTLNPIWDNEKEDALNVFKMIDLLNELNDKCEFLEIENESLENGATKYAELYHQSLKENEQLKQQLYYDGDSVCNICKHQYLVETEKYYVAKCEKEHEKCSKEDIKYCEDFKVKGDYE